MHRKSAIFTSECYSYHVISQQFGRAQLEGINLSPLFVLLKRCEPVTSEGI